MFAPFKIRVGARSVALALALAASSFSAHAVLQRAGPVGIAPNVGGFPTWYQDTTGLALEFCSPKNLSELDGGWCLLLPPDVTVVPEAFPSNFFDEHFYYAAGAGIGTRVLGAKANLVIGMEGAFVPGAVVAGDQVAFARIRVVLNPVPLSGTYRFIHPYGENSIEGVAGLRIFYTDDFGAMCGLNFDCALNGRMGPFLLPSATVGGAEMPALTEANPTPDIDPAHFGGVFAATPYPATGNAYIADPARVGPVTGSTLPDFTDSTGALRNHNIFRIEGPAGSGLGVDPVTGALVDWIETTDFSLMGRVFAGAMPGRVTIERATYGRTDLTSPPKLDVFATAVATTQGRLPTGPTPIPGLTTITFFDQPCAGTVDAVGTVHPPFTGPAGAIETPMRQSGNLQWAQTHPVVLPTAVCVKDATAKNAAGVIVPIYVSQAVTDEVAVTPAFYDPTAATLSVGGTSSDTALPVPTLTVAYAGFQGNLVAGQIAVPGMIAPPSNLFMQSSGLGSTRYQVSTGFVGAATIAVPIALNDTFVFPMNSGANVLAVLANDSNAIGGTVTLTSVPAFGTAVVNLDGTVTYTPNLNASGADAFTYTVTVGTQVSNNAIASLNIASLDLPPVAVNDTINAIANIPAALNVIANDTDPNGQATIVAAVNVTQPTPAGATTSVAGGIVNFNATAPGTYTFTYQAQDATGLVSANTATVTVQVAAVETVGITSNLFVLAKNRLTVVGTIAPVMFQTVRVDFVNGLGTVVGTAATVASTVLGGWSIDTVVPLPAGTVSIKATTSNGTVRATALTLK
jgi:hypothetical protein